MRFALLAALLLAACMEPREAAPAGAEKAAPRVEPIELARGCNQQRQAPVTFSNPARPDMITVRAEGPSCDQAVLTFVLRNAEGDVLWAMADTMRGMTISDPPFTDAQVSEFLRMWSEARSDRTGELPEWTEGAESLQAAHADEGGVISTPFTRADYESNRARNLSMLCMLNGHESGQCLIIDPLSNAPTIMMFQGA